MWQGWRQIGIWKQSGFPGGLICMIMSPSLPAPRKGRGAVQGAAGGSREVGKEALAGVCPGRALPPAPFVQWGFLMQ